MAIAATAVPMSRTDNIHSFVNRCLLRIMDFRSPDDGPAISIRKIGRPPRMPQPPPTQDLFTFDPGYGRRTCCHMTDVKSASFERQGTRFSFPLVDAQHGETLFQMGRDRP
jgi:hypothetical protein